MRLTKWYSLALASGAFVVAVLVAFTAYLNARELANGSVSLYWVAVDFCALIASGALFLIGSAFVVGLIEVVRAPVTNPFALAPVVLLLTVAAITTAASAVSWYGVVSTTEMSAYGAGPAVVQEVIVNLGVGLGLAAVLYLTTVYHTHRAI